MSTGYTPSGRDTGVLDYSDYEDAKGQGLVTFAGVLLTIAGVVNTIYGIAAIGKASFFINNARYVFGDLRLWGWFVLALGILQFFAAGAVWRGESWARWFGVAVGSLNMILQIMWLPSYPLLSLVILPLDLIAVYGLLMYGGRRRSYRDTQARAAA